MKEQEQKRAEALGSRLVREDTVSDDANGGPGRRSTIVSPKHNQTKEELKRKQDEEMFSNYHKDRWAWC